MPWTPAIACGSCKIPSPPTPPTHPHPSPPQTPSLRVGLSGSAFIEKMKGLNRETPVLGRFFRTRCAFPTLSKVRSGQNRQSVFLGRLLERFAERREDARGLRRKEANEAPGTDRHGGCGSWRGNLFGGRPSPPLTDEKNRWYSAAVEGCGSKNRMAVNAKHVALYLELGASGRSSEKSH